MLYFLKNTFTSITFYQFFLALLLIIILFHWRQQALNLLKRTFYLGNTFKHYHFLKSAWFWLGIGFILSTLFFSLGLNLTNNDVTAIATIVINSLTALGTLAAV